MGVAMRDKCYIGIRLHPEGEEGVEVTERSKSNLIKYPPNL